MTDKLREEIAKAFCLYGTGKCVEQRVCDGCAAEIDMALPFIARARAEALEEAASIPFMIDGMPSSLAHKTRNAIRALKEKSE